MFISVDLVYPSASCCNEVTAPCRKCYDCVTLAIAWRAVYKAAMLVLKRQPKTHLQSTFGAPSLALWSLAFGLVTSVARAEPLPSTADLRPLFDRYGLARSRQRDRP